MKIYQSEPVKGENRQNSNVLNFEDPERGVRVRIEIDHPLSEEEQKDAQGFVSAAAIIAHKHLVVDKDREAFQKIKTNMIETEIAISRERSQAQAA
jgi:hypothetical protein